MTLQCCTSSARVIHSTLRQPPAAAIFRLVLWETFIDGIDPDILSVIGLRLKIQPRVFQAVMTRDSTIDSFFTDVGEQILPTNIVAMGQFAMTVARPELPTNPNVTPVILIIGYKPDTLTVKKARDEVLLFEKATSPLTTEQSNPMEQPSLWMQEYVRLLEAHPTDNVSSDASDTDLISRSVIPLLHFQISTIREECHLKRTEYIKSTKGDKGDLGALFKERSHLRRMIEESEDNFQHLQRFKFSRKGNHTFQDAAFMIVEDDLRRAHLEAVRLETEIRDYLQLQTGDLALRESIKSIELSSSQIEEAKRG